MKLDECDRRILGALQRDASQTVAAIAEQAGLSATPCWRRIQRLEAAGIIRKRVALLDREQLNAGTHRVCRHAYEYAHDGMAGEVYEGG